MNHLKYILRVLFLFLFLAGCSESKNNSTENQTYEKPNFEEQAKDLVAQMTLEEKVSQMHYESPGIPRLNIPEYNWWNECLQ